MLTLLILAFLSQQGESGSQMIKKELAVTLYVCVCAARRWWQVGGCVNDLKRKNCNWDQEVENWRCICCKL